MSFPETITSEIQKLAPSAIVELFELDLTPWGADIQYFHAGTNELSQNVVFDSITYVRFPIQVSGFEFSGNSQLPRPKLTVSNLFGSITSLLLIYGEFLGAKLTRRRTLAKYLDAVNFAGGVNVSAEPTAAFPDDVYFVERKVAENPQTIEFELASSFDVQGVNLPRRQIIANICVWKYRGAECGFTGAPLFSATDLALTSAETTEGQAVLDAAATVRSTLATLSTAEDALTAAQRAQDTICEYRLLDTKFNLAVPYSYIQYDGITKIVLGAYYNGSPVTLGTVYRPGALNSDIPTFGAVQKWAIDSSGCTTATTARNTARTARNTAKTAYDNAVTAFNAAVAALPSDDPLYLQDSCSKKISSCKLRFGEKAELPFGSFPSAGLIR